MKTVLEPASAVAPKFYACPIGRADDLNSVGAKAYTLGQMMKLGIPVPPGFVLCNDAFEEFLRANNLRERIANLCDTLDVRSPGSLHNAAQAIGALVVTAKIPRCVGEEIALLCKAMLSADSLIVRSSAVGEDSREASFAGQLDSFPNLNSSEALEAALLSCWASYWSERSLFYQLSRGLRLRGLGVIIQKMILPEVSGVLFTSDPSTSDRNPGELLLEYCQGQAEPLVSGRINPGRLTISRSDFRWREESRPEQPLQWRAEQLLFRRGTLSLLAELGLKLEREFGRPQDIEWAIDHAGNLFLVQSRPITTPLTQVYSVGESHSGSAAAEGQPLVVWSNANVNENFPNPITPLLYSIASTGYYYYFRNLAAALGISRRRIYAMEHRLRNIIGVHGGRMYYNLTNIHAALSLAPFGERLVDDFNLFVGAQEKTGATRVEKKDRFRQLAELVVMAIQAAWHGIFLSRRVRQFEQMVADYAARTRPETLSQRSLHELLEEFRAFLDIRFHRWTNAALADAASMVFYGTLKQLILREFPNADETSLHNTLLKGLRNIVSSVPALKLWELSRTIREDPALAALFGATPSNELLKVIHGRAEFNGFRRPLDDFLNDWGFRCSGELMLTVPSFQEDPAPLFDILKGYIKMENQSPEQVILAQQVEREAKLADVLEALKKRRPFSFFPWLSVAHAAKFLLRCTHRSIALRERARLKQSLLYSRCRRIALAMGEKLSLLGHIERPDDVFFLIYQELDQLVSGGAMFPYHIRELAAQRKNAHAELSAMNPPDSFALVEGQYLSLHPIRSSQSCAEKAADCRVELAGTSACGGQTTGRATILNDVAESKALNPGDVLVTRQTDPGWGPVFFLIRGLVLERGGMLSHGAIIAREFGIPSVVGVKNATQRIRQGQEIRVDGDHGVVNLL